MPIIQEQREPRMTNRVRDDESGELERDVEKMMLEQNQALREEVKFRKKRRPGRHQCH